MLNVTNDFRQNVYAPIRQFNGKMIFTIDGVSTTFYDDKIMSFQINEEMNVINNTLPSNEISITMNNENGDFNMLNYQNMFEIIAGRPKIEVFCGLVNADIEAQTVATDFVGKKKASLVENPNKAFYGGASTLTAPSAFVTEFNDTAIGLWDSYASLYYDDNKNTETSTTSVGTILQHLFSFNIFQVLERKFGTVIWQGKTTNAEKVAIASSMIKTFNCTAKIFGNTSAGNKANFTMRYGYNADGTGSGTWSSPPASTTSSTKTNVNITTSTIAGKIDSNGFVHFLVYGDPNPTATTAKIQTEYITLSIDVNATQVIEYIPMGVFYLIEWKSEVNNMIITLTGRDNFDLLNDVSYDNTTTDTYYNLAVDILTKAGITNYYVDDHLKDFSGNFNDRTDSRSALQNLGIASRSAVWQDRTGKVNIKPFQYLDESSNYLTYVGSPQVIAGTYWAQPIVSTGAGMKYIDFDQMYDSPQVSLEKSISQIIVKIYIDQENPIEKTYINTAIGGKGGSSFLLDNDLIDTVEVADDVAEWFIRETNYSAVYRANWRQNPILESGDVVLIEDSFGAGKQTRIYSQTFNYEGYLYGSTESRGGI